MTSILTKYTTDLPREGANDGGAGGAGGAGGGAGGAGGAGAGAAAGGAVPWYQGQADAETIGWLQNKINSTDLTDPAKVALATTKAAREAERMIGIPLDRRLNLPDKTAEPAAWESVYQRLGKPADAKEYDFSAVKHADGSVPAQSLLDAARAAAFNAHAPKDRAADFATALVKHLDAAKAEHAAAKAQTVAEQKAKLAQNWGTKAEENRLTAMQGARRLGITPDAVALLEQQIGYDGVMEAMRKIGAGTTEDTFVESGNRTGAPATIESAQQRLTELTADKAWAKRLTDGDIAARREWLQLTSQIAGVAA